MLEGTSELLLSFVAAFEHMPLHRRLHLFKLLISKLGPQDSLFAVLAMLVDKYRDDKDVLGFAADLASQYETVTRLVVSGYPWIRRQGILMSSLDYAAVYRSRSRLTRFQAGNVTDNLSWRRNNAASECSQAFEACRKDPKQYPTKIHHRQVIL